MCHFLSSSSKAAERAPLDAGQAPRRTGPSSKRSRLLPAGRHCASTQKRGAPVSTLHPPARALGSSPRGVSSVGLLLHEVIHDGGFRSGFITGLLTAWIARGSRRTTSRLL
ncbi:unnamed protein product [Pleuronectes platessa]|uniref:Uncharacterized protein n=1 Tax=Pleuronectes platessa TaxID=8262 RepID=A0A9N7W1T3_PLEPL|nr:unnamed protein product [Pleuronectes platessa]